MGSNNTKQTETYFQQDDTVAIFRNGQLRIGIVSQVYDEYENDDYDDDDENERIKLKPDKVRVDWYPSGKQTTCNKTKLALVDRALQLGETVCRLEQPERIGLITNLNITADIVILPDRQTVITDVALNRTSFVAQYAVDDDRSYILWNHWIGSVMRCVYRLQLICDRGYRCSVRDISTNRITPVMHTHDGSVFDTVQWYPGQAVLIPYRILRSANWLTAPPHYLQRRFLSRRYYHRRMRFTIEKVEIDTLTINWNVCLNVDNITVPKRQLSGDDLASVFQLDHFVFHNAQVGDRMNVSRNAQDNIVSIADWSNSFVDCMRRRELSTFAQNAETTASTIDSKPTNADCCSSRRQQNTTTITSLNDDIVVKSNTHVGGHKQCRLGRSFSFRGDRRRGATSLRGKRNRISLKRKATDDHMHTTANERAIRVDETIVGEILALRTIADVFWMDGCTEKGISTTQLEYADLDLDQHDVIPGSIVSLKSDGNNKLSIDVCLLLPDARLGCVLDIEHHRRLANVQWYKLEVGTDCDPICEGRQLESLFDLDLHEQYGMAAPLQLVLRVGGSRCKEANIFSKIGQVKSVNVDECKQLVYWFDGSEELIWPTHITGLFPEENDDDDDMESINNMSIASNSSQHDSHADVDDGDISEIDEEVYIDATGDFEDVGTWESMSVDSTMLTTGDDEQVGSIVQDVAVLDGDGGDIVVGKSADNCLVTGVECAETAAASSSIIRSTFTEKSSSFEIVELCPREHQYASDSFQLVKCSPRFMRSIGEEHQLMHSSLPAGIFIKTFENRIDLFSCLMVGPSGTPYQDGLFSFDIRLPNDYPNVPPMVFYRSYSKEQLNPNLYLNGKVCISLIGTWSGRGSEVWNPGSNLLQLLISIQGLILNREPYFNEAGYETRRGYTESIEKSRRYNEMALIRSIDNLVQIVQHPPALFATEIRRHVNERVDGLIKQVRVWLNGSQSADFPLCPISDGCRLSIVRGLAKLESTIATTTLSVI